MELSLPKPSIEDLRALRNDKGTIRVALDVKSALARIVQNLQPETISAFARQCSPGCTLIEAIGAALVMTAYGESEVEAFNAQARTVQAEEAERIANEKQGRSVAELEEELARIIGYHAKVHRFVRTKLPEDIPAFLSF